MKFHLALNYSQENSFPIYLFFNKLINSCNVKLQQRHLADIYEKLAHSMPITMQCGGKPKNSPTLTANNSGLKPSKLKNYNIFEMGQINDFVQILGLKTPIFVDTFLDHLTLSNHNSCSKPPNLKNYHIFGILRTSAFSWYTLVRSYYWKTLRKMRFRFLSFHHKQVFSAGSSLPHIVKTVKLAV